MAYRVTVVLHEDTWTPSDPPSWFEKSSRRLEATSTVWRTEWRYDDADGEVPSPSGNHGELDRYDLPVGPQEANRQVIRDRAEKAMATLQAQIDDTSVTNAEAIEYLRHHAQVLRRLVRLAVGLLDATD